MLPTAPLALVLCWWSLEMETNSKCALFAEKADGARICLLCKGPTSPTFARYGGTQLWPSQKRHKTSFWELHS